MAIQIFKGISETNNHSKVDGIGAQRASMPNAIYTYLINEPEFDWIWDDNNNFEKFLILNPQFDARYRTKYSAWDLFTIPIINKNGMNFYFKESPTQNTKKEIILPGQKLT